MANENRLWGAERVRGELLKLGIRVSKRTIQRYLPKERKTSKKTGQLSSRIMRVKSGLVISRWGSHPKYLIRDHDRKYGFLFSSVAASIGIQEVKTPFQAPKANAVCERFMGSLKCECLDHTLVLNQRQLERLVKEYGSYYNTF